MYCFIILYLSTKKVFISCCSTSSECHIKPFFFVRCKTNENRRDISVRPLRRYSVISPPFLYDDSFCFLFYIYPRTGISFFFVSNKSKSVSRKKNLLLQAIKPQVLKSRLLGRASERRYPDQPKDRPTDRQTNLGRISCPSFSYSFLTDGEEEQKKRE